MSQAQSAFDELDEAAEAAAIAIAEAEIDAGGGVPHDRVRVWLDKLARGEVEPPPTA